MKILTIGRTDPGNPTAARKMKTKRGPDHTLQNTLIARKEAIMESTGALIASNCFLVTEGTDQADQAHGAENHDLGLKHSSMIQLCRGVLTTPDNMT